MTSGHHFRIPSIPQDIFSQGILFGVSYYSLVGAGHIFDWPIASEIATTWLMFAALFFGYTLSISRSRCKKQCKVSKEPEEVLSKAGRFSAGKAKLCEDLVQQGVCPRGKACPWSHEDVVLSDQSHESNSKIDQQDFGRGGPKVIPEKSHPDPTEGSDPPPRLIEVRPRWADLSEPFENNLADESNITAGVSKDGEGAEWESELQEVRRFEEKADDLEEEAKQRESELQKLLQELTIKTSPQRI